mgnify:CR=1 FL=1
MKDRIPEKAFNLAAWVKPEGSEARVDSTPSMQRFENPMFPENLMEEVCERSNMIRALKRVTKNKGCAGIDGMEVKDLPVFLTKSWSVIRYQLLTGNYVPQPIKRVDIPKPKSPSEKRKLGIPCCIDRLIQQALLQVLQRTWDPFFSDSSFGFRPERSCHQAIARAQSYIREGHHIVVDIDLSKFFDEVCHERLMSKLSRHISDKRVLKLIRRFLTAGIMDQGLASTPSKGTPQGGPLSPFLSSIVLDELDNELEKRELKFVRYADDCNIYVKSRRAGERVMKGIVKFIEVRLKLKVNRKKSAVDSPQKRSFLGFSFTGGKIPFRRKVAPASIADFRVKVRKLTRRNSGISMEERIKRLNLFLIGWKGYYGYSEAHSIFRDLDSWIRRRLRCIQWKYWKTYRRRREELLKLGVSEDHAQPSAWSSRGPWCMSHIPGIRIALNNKYFDSLGLYRLSRNI